jgi:predicted glycogen debranching enzyme
MDDPVLTQVPLPRGGQDLTPLLEKEWLVTNGLGGYASGTVAGAATRRYHGLLVAAHPAPLGRVMMCNHLWEYVRLGDYSTVQIGGEELVGGRVSIHGADHLADFQLEAGLPVWRYQVRDFLLEKRLFLAYRHNTTYVCYRLLRGPGKVRLKLRPSVHFRGHDTPVSESLGGPYVLTVVEDRYELSGGPQWPTLRLAIDGAPAAFTAQGQVSSDLLYRIEESRGYEYQGALWSPGFFRLDLEPGQEVAMIASTEDWGAVRAVPLAEAYQAERQRRRRLVEQAAPAARTGTAAELVLAADQFIITPTARVMDAARARAAGDEARTVIAGYHWFTDWGRDTMISLEGLALVTGRQHEAGHILRTFANYVKDGLIPNLFPEGGQEGLYHTADASLWFFHAVQRYLDFTGDRTTLRLLLPKLRDVVDHHLTGTRFGIRVDPADGLLRQGAPGYQLTWMDAKVGDWVVTPRRGKAVEICAMWYNALRLLEGWLRGEGEAAAARELAGHAEQARRSFNRRFWYEGGGYLYDVVDTEQGGDDPSCRPNQVFAISLDYPVLDEARWRPVLAVLKERLLTPVGLRSLAPGEPEYKPRYFGDLRARDAAYHQGTVWAWLIGPFVDAWLRAHPDDRAGARRFLDGFAHHLREACVGSISEVFDAEEPYTPRGCIAQAWSVAEVLRCLVKTAG